MDKIRCCYEFCCYPAVANFVRLTGVDGVTRTWGLCTFHATDKGESR